MNLSKKKNSVKDIWLGDQLLLMKTFENFFKALYLVKCAQFLSALYIVLVSLKMTLFIEKILISNRYISCLMPNLIKNLGRSLLWRESSQVLQKKKSIFCIPFWTYFLATLSVQNLTYVLKFIFSKEATKIDEIFTVNLTLST